ncbi:MAG: protein kinase, partial [Planctomycetes bacterium]|nr:protein kinase [Planctomycetota bacterium]
LAVPSREAWELERKLGEGGFGEVWLAHHRETRYVRAFKFCFRSDRLRSLKRELKLFGLLREALGERPDIARLYEVRLQEAPYFLEMEYTAGGNLA